MLYSVVIPCYNSSKTIARVVESTIAEFRKIEISEFEFVLVNDCSPDGGATVKELFRLSDLYSFVKVVDLGKNCGQHNATMAGLKYASGDFIISMDDDGQTRPSEIIRMKSKIEEGYDIVYGYYEEKKESAFRRFGSSLNHLTVRLLIDKPSWMKTSSFWIIRKYVRDYAITYKHPNVHLQGVFLRITKNIACVKINHYEREVGKSGYTFKKLLALYGNIYGFSLLPLKLVTYTGFFFASLGLLSSLVLVIRRLMVSTVSTGWTSVFCSICFFSGLILIAIGISGSYIGKIFMSETCYPQYVVRNLRNIQEED